MACRDRYKFILLHGCAFILLAGCADMPRGQHGERLAIRHGWLEVAEISDSCVYEQREYALRIRCIL